MKWVSHLRAWLDRRHQGRRHAARKATCKKWARPVYEIRRRALLARGRSEHRGRGRCCRRGTGRSQGLAIAVAGVELALAYEPLIAEKAKANQGARTDLRPILDKSFKPVDTHKKIAKAAKVDPATIAKVKLIAFANISEGNRHEARGRQDCKNVVR